MIRAPSSPQWRRIVTPIALAGVSLFTALVLWIAVSDAENPQTEFEVRGVQVEPVNVPEGLAVASISPNPVRLMVRADSDLVGKVAPSDFRVIVDLTNVRESTESPVLIDEVLTDEDVDPLDIFPGSVRVELEQSVSKIVPVRLMPVGQLPQGYSSAQEVSPASVRVTGARSLIDRLEYASAEVNLTGLRSSLNQQAVLVPRDSRGLELVRLQVEPLRGETRVTVNQDETPRQLPIVASLQGTVAEGYNIVSIQIDPQNATISGPLETTQALATISTEPVDVSGLTRDVSRTVRLRLPSGVESNRDSVTVRVRIAPAPGELLVTLVPQASNVGDGLTASFQTASVTVRLAGDVPTLKQITPGTVRAVVNAEGRQEGPHILEPQIADLPPGVRVVSMDPTQVVLVLRR